MTTAGSGQNTKTHGGDRNGADPQGGLRRSRRRRQVRTDANPTGNGIFHDHGLARSAPHAEGCTM
jgi:hypothetical protein